MKLLFGGLVALAALFLGHGEKLRPIKGMQQLSLVCKSPEQLSFIHALEDNPNLDFLKLTRVLNEPIDVLVTATELPMFKELLSLKEIDYTVTIDDVERAVQEEKLANEFARWRSMSRRSGDELRAFDYYPRFKEIELYLRNLTQAYGKLVSLQEIGKSYEGRPMYVVKVSSGGSNKPAIFIDGGIHAREWIAPSTVLFALHQIVTNSSNSVLYRDVDWYILPSMNPDGYEYTHTTNRFWRKTVSANPGSSCIGTDLNRNFDYKWMTVGASSDPCEEDYAGSKPFSEVESQAVRDFLLKNQGTIKVYLSFHSYGSYLLYPWGWTSSLPDNEPILRKTGEAAAEALFKIYGTEYVVGSSANVVYAAAGGSDDWAMAVAGADLSYVIELPGDRFDPPVDRIEPVGIETFEAIKVFHNYVREKYVLSRQDFTLKLQWNSFFRNFFLRQ